MGLRVLSVVADGGGFLGRLGPERTVIYARRANPPQPADGGGDIEEVKSPPPKPLPGDPPCMGPEKTTKELTDEQERRGNLGNRTSAY